MNFGMPTAAPMMLRARATSWKRNRDALQSADEPARLTAWFNASEWHVRRSDTALSCASVQNSQETVTAWFAS